MIFNYLVGSLFWLLIGILTIIGGYHLGLGRVNKPGSGFIFFWAAFLLIILSTIDLAGTIFSKAILEKYKREPPIWTGGRWKNLVMVFLSLVGYIYFLEILGFRISTFLLMIFLFKIVEPTGWFTAIFSSLITVSISWLLFYFLLNVPLPTGLLEF